MLIFNILGLFHNFRVANLHKPNGICDKISPKKHFGSEFTWFSPNLRAVVYVLHSIDTHSDYRLYAESGGKE